MNPQELRKGKADHLKKRALLITKTFILGMLGPLGPLMMGCGTVKDGALHDHGNRRMVRRRYDYDDEQVEYDEVKHGPITDFVNEGDVLFKSEDGSKKGVHRHPKNGERLPISGDIEYQWE